MGKVLSILILLSASAWAQRFSCPGITTVAQLDECLVANGQRATRTTQEIVNWRRRLGITTNLVIEAEKIQSIVEETCTGNESSREVATMLSSEVANILRVGSLQITDWRVPNFPETGARDYSLRGACRVNDLFQQMKADVDRHLPDLTNVYNLGLALDTTSSQENNMAALLSNIDYIYSSIPANANIAFVVTDYGDAFRSGLRFEGDKNYVLSRVKNFIRTRRIHGGNTPPEFVYGGSHITSRSLGRAHGLIFNWTNAPHDNSRATTRNGELVPYTLRDLGNQARRNVHVVRNVFLRCR